MEKPLVSVIMAAHNVENYIGEAIESVQAQTYSNWELVITNDGSPDNTAQIIAEYAARDPRITVVTHDKSQGQAIARNDAVEKARGVYLAVLDSDDVSMPDRFEKQVAYLESHPNVAALGSYATLIDFEGKKLGEKVKTTSWLEMKFPLLLQTPFIHSAVMMRTDVFKKLGGYRTEFLHAEDFDLWSRMLDAGYELDNLPESLIKFRIQPQSVTQMPTTQRVQERNAIAINARNLKPYIELSEEHLRRLVDLLNNRSLSVPDLLASLHDYRTLVDAYCKKNSDPKEIAYVHALYQEKRQHFLRMKLKSILFGRTMRYLFAGGLGAATNLGTFAVLIALHVWYLYASIAAFCLSVVVSFIMQKFITFRDHSLDRVHHQALIFLGVSLANLAINTGLVYLFVDGLSLNKILSQALAAILIAISSYFIYNKIVFTHRV